MGRVPVAARVRLRQPREDFSVQHVLPNLARYPRWLVESHTPLVLLALVAPAVLWSRRREDGGGERWLLGWVLLAVATLVFATYLFFTPFDDWAFLRYLLPAVPLLVALSAVVLVAGLRRLPGMAGTSAIALACGLLVWFSMQEAARRDVFVLKAREQKYLDAGAWVASRLPERAVILTLQQSGSLRLYADRLTVRWDLLDPGWLDPAIRFFDDHGRPPYLLVEGLEEPLFRARFGGRSSYGDLDGGRSRKSASCGSTTRISDGRSGSRLTAQGSWLSAPRRRRSALRLPCPAFRIRVP